MKQEKKREILILLLNDLKKYHSALSHFVRIFNKETKGSQSRNFPQRIISGEIRFERGLHQYVDIAIAIAKELLDKYGQKRISYLSSVKLSSILDTSNRANILIDHVSFIHDAAELKGEYASALINMQHLESIISESKLQKVSPYHAAYFNHVFSKIQIQLGQRDGPNGAFSKSSLASELFKEIGEQEQMLLSLSLQGNILRQKKMYQEAYDLFSSLDGLVQSIRSKSEMKVVRLQKNQHQKAVSLMRKGNSSGDQGVFDKSLLLYNESNAVFEYGDNQEWYNHTLLREAEAYVKANKLVEAEKRLSFFDDIHVYSLFLSPQKTIYLRIQAEFFLRSGDMKSGIKYINTAYQLARREGYVNEMTQLKELEEAFLGPDRLRKSIC